jgi:hypothetical protein
VDEFDARASWGAAVLRPFMNWRFRFGVRGGAV